jgi:IclR family transcriptional regulator, KDG regulon repressor
MRCSVRHVSAVQSVDRSFDLLDATAAAPGTSSNLARRVGLSTSTTARHAGFARGAVARDSQGVYRIGPGIEALAAAADPSHDLVSIATSTLLELAADLGESTSLGIPSGEEMRYVAQMNTNNPVQVRDWVGSRAPMHGGAPGYVVMAHWPEERIDAYLAGVLSPVTRYNNVAPQAIRACLDAVRTDGVIWSHQEGAEGISVVAAPVCNSSGTVVASLQAWGPTYRFPAVGQAQAAASAVHEAATHVSAMLGLRRGPFAHHDPAPAHPQADNS